MNTRHAVSNFICCTLLCALFLSCHDRVVGPEPAGHPDADLPDAVLPYENVQYTDVFQAHVRGTAVMRDSIAWKQFTDRSWDVMEGNGSPVPPPSIDFSRKMVIGVTYGDGYSGCKVAVEVIQSIRRHRGQIEVQVGPLPSLGMGIIYCDMLVQPLQLVVLDRSDLPVTFLGCLRDLQPAAGRRER